MGDKPRIIADPLTYTRQGDSTVLKPQAQALDTFIRPAEPVKSSWHGLAQSLAEIKPSLNKYIDDTGKDIAFEDARKAEADGMISTATDWNDAIKKGEVSAGASPLYQRVYEETIGKLSATNVAQATLWQKWMAPENEIRSTQDPEVIGKWFAEQRKGFVEGKSKDFSAGFMPSFGGVQQQLTQRIISDNVKELEGKNHDALGQLMTDTIMANRNLSAPEIAAKLASDGLPQRFAGMQGKEVNTVMAKAIIAAATKLNDPRLLQIGYADRPDTRNPGQTIRGVFSIPDFASAATTAQTQMESRAYTNAARADHALNVTNKRSSAEARIAILQDQQANQDNPDWTPDPKMIAKGVAADPDFASKVMTQTSALKKATKPMNPAVATILELDLADKAAKGINISEDLIAYAKANALTPATITGLIKTQTSLASENSILKNPAYTDWHDQVKGSIDQLTTKLDSGRAKALTGQALSSLRIQALDYEDQRKREGKPLNTAELSDFLDGAAAKTLKRLAVATARQDTPQGGVTDDTDKKLFDTKTPLPEAAPTGAFPKKAAPVFAPIKAGFVLPPEAMNSTQAADGSSAPVDWTPTDEAKRDLTADFINKFRAEPDKAGVGGKLLWQRIDEKYGKGAAAFLLKDDTALAVFAPQPKKK